MVVRNRRFLLFPQVLEFKALSSSLLFFQAEGNNVAALPGNRPPTYSTDMGFTNAMHSQTSRNSYTLLTSLLSHKGPKPIYFNMLEFLSIQARQTAVMQLRLGRHILGKVALETGAICLWLLIAPSIATDRYVIEYFTTNVCRRSFSKN
jgi:hypothetical protein